MNQQHEIGWRSWPELRNQSEPSPEIPPSQALPQGLQPPTTHTDPAGPLPRRRRRRPDQAGGGQPLRGGILSPGARRQHPAHRHRQDPSVPDDPGRLGPPGVWPWPAHSLQRSAPQLEPDAQPIPPHLERRWRQVGQQDPGGRVCGVPDSQQGTRLAFGPRLEGDAVADPRPARAWDQTTRGPQPGTPHLSVGQHQHCQGGGEDRLERVHQRQDRGHPRPRLMGRPDRPRHRDGTAPIPDTVHQGYRQLALRGGIQGQGQRGPLSPGQHPAQQGRQAGRHLHLRPTGRRFVPPRRATPAAVAAPYASPHGPTRP